jgi:hypothetical protein
MKKIIILSLFLAGVSSLFAKDVSIRVVNENDFPLSIMCGTISNKDNSYSDDEIVQKRKELSIISAGRPLAPNKKTQFNKNDLSGGSILIVFGMCQGGGRTNIFRYRVKDLDKELDLTFEKVPNTKVNNSYINIAEGLKSSEDLGSYYLNAKNQIAGAFIFFNITAEKMGEVFVAAPPSNLEVEIGEKQENTESDFLLKSAVPPFINIRGKLVKSVPPNDSMAYLEVVIPGIDKSVEIFGDNMFKFLTWKITGSMRINAKYKGKSFLTLFNSTTVPDRKSIMDKFIKDLSEKGSSDYLLCFITSVHHTDSMSIIDEGIRKIEEYEQILENDLMSAKGNYRFDDNNKTVFQASNLINDVKAIDITPLLYYSSIIQGRFSNTVASATNCADVYKLLGNFIELPALDDKALSITSPTYTLTKIKELINYPNVLPSIEAKLLVQIPGSIPISAAQAAQVKLDTKKK